MLQHTSEKRKKIATIIAFASVPLSGFMTDIYLPSFPSMAKDLAVPEHDVQLTLTVFLLSYGVSQLFIGSILDSIGRYKPKLIALVVLILCSIFISLSSSITAISLLRMVQGVAISLMVVANRAFFVDMYQGEKLKNYLSYFTIVWSCGPIIAPFLGGYLEKLFTWHANFYFLAIYGSILLILDLIFSGETLMNKKKFNLKEVTALYRSMLGNTMFILGIITLGIAYSVVMVFNITGPFIIENAFHQNSVVIGYCTLILGFSWMIGGILSKKLAHYSFKKRILFPALLQVVLIAILLGIGLGYENLYLLVGFAFAIHICSGFLYTIFFTTSMLYFPNNAGIAGGLLGGLVYVITSITSYVISNFGHVNTQLDLTWRYLIMSALLLIVVWFSLQIAKRKG
ncbi:MFS transporter [Flavobacterium sp. xlx-214]|uniref:MFS transporter n=1 Tax=unclassified Flavobacterium TaxID=196869 RepID=UPI0013D68D59|nr:MULTISPECIES: MFS transporter [unclassified Flavobacterium]MBA5792546.1 MFS transporter [Flavobacterium sp. xlx-221]QMI82304.1 MFS transporter [Flavobacterium sp. xlx-214]